jgi:hypothetical protein
MEAIIMETRILEFKLKPSDPEPSLYVTINFHGDIVEARGYSPIVDDFGDVTEIVKNDDYWNKQIGKRFAEVCWKDEDAGFESFKDMMGSAFRGESA